MNSSKSIFFPNKPLVFFALVLVTVIILVTSAGSLAAPPAPFWVDNLVAGNQIILTWLPIPGAVRYSVYMNGRKTGETPINQYIGPAPSKSGKYKFTMTATDASGIEGPESTAAYMTITLPEPPRNFIVRQNLEEKLFLLQWSRPPFSDVIKVFRGTSKEGPWELRGSVKEESFKDSDVEVGRAYFYLLTSRDMMGKESEPSAVVEATLPR